MKRALPAFLCAALSLVVAGCDGGESPAPTALAPLPPPPPPPFSASFVEDSLEVREGESVQIDIAYTVRDLASPVALQVRAAVESASAEDFELIAEAAEIPAGQGVSGAASVQLTALADTMFNESDETLHLTFASTGAAANATLGEPLAVTIVETGASPCAGVTIRAEPWREEEWRASASTTMLASMLELELTGRALDTRVELIGPYYNLYDGGSTPRAVASFGISAWRVLPGDGSVRHELDINWPGESWFEEEPNLEFRILGPTCAGEPVASCSSETCEVIP